MILHISAINGNHMMYGSWDIEHDRQNFLSLWTIFCPFTSLTTRKIKILKNEKNTWRYYHFTPVTINDNHVMYGSWDMKLTDRFFCYLDHFLPLYLPNNPKNQNFEKLKKHLETLSFYTSVPKIMIICYNVSKIWCLMDVIVIFNFGLFSTLLPP